MEPWSRLPREAVESPSLEIFQPHLDTVLCSLLWVTLLGEGVGLGDPQRVLPTPTMLGLEIEFIPPGVNMWSTHVKTLAHTARHIGQATPYQLCAQSSAKGQARAKCLKHSPRICSLGHRAAVLLQGQRRGSIS